MSALIDWVQAALITFGHLLTVLALAAAAAWLLGALANQFIPRGPVSRWASDDGWDEASLDALAAQKRIHDRRQGGAA